MLKNKNIKIACFGNLGFKKMGILKKNKLLFRGGFLTNKEKPGVLPETGFLIRIIPPCDLPSIKKHEKRRKKIM